MAVAAITLANVLLPFALTGSTTVQAIPANYTTPTHPIRHFATQLASATNYVIRSGDTLSRIAQNQLGSSAKWQYLWALNQAKIANPNLIYPGTALSLTGTVTSMPKAPAPVPAPVAKAIQAPAATVNPSNYSGFQACVIARESGGNTQVMNSTGHYGLYQFSYSTWVVYGGNGADFGHASAAEQNQVFANAMARGGQFNWSPYDGC
jgi:LysM repeat protein